jgi:2'-5' RNA ligase
VCVRGSPLPRTRTAKRVFFGILPEKQIKDSPISRQNRISPGKNQPTKWTAGQNWHTDISLL